MPTHTPARAGVSAAQVEPTSDLSHSGSDGAGEIFTTQEAAAYLKLSASTLEKLRVRGDGPIYAQPTRRVIYRQRDLDDWLNQARRSSTSETQRPANPHRSHLDDGAFS